MRRLRRSDLADSRWGGPWLAFAVLLAAAAGLRLVGVRYALPFPLLNPDERNIVPRAWAMTHGAGADPGWFDYPSLVLYLLAPFQAWHDDPSYLTARIVMIGIGVAGIAAAWWLGAKAYGTLAGFVAAVTTAVATVHVAYSRMAVTDIPLALGTTVALALLVMGRIELAGLAIGLAASAKYPGLILLAPLIAVAWGKWRRLAVAAALSLVAFALTSPYVILRIGDAADDALRVQRAARAGWLGFENDSPTPIAFVERLWDGVGPALVVAALGLALALVRRSRADLALSVFCLAYFAQLMTIDAHFDRYVLPLIPALGALAGRLRAIAPVTLLLLVVPLTWSIRETRELQKTDTRIPMAAWIERNVSSEATIAADPSTPDLPRHRVLHLRLPRPGEPFDRNRSLESLRNQGIRHVLVTGAVADRVRAARDRYPREQEFYSALERRGALLFEVNPGRRFVGPWVRIFRLS